MSLLTLLRGYFLRITHPFPAGNAMGATIYASGLSGSIATGIPGGRLSTAALRGELS